MLQFFHTAKYAAFVWPAYGISGLGILAAVLLTLRASARIRAELKSLEQLAK